MSSAVGHDRGTIGRRGTGSAGSLRGRASELAKLEALTHSAREGAGEVVVLEGAAGIGKSRLLAEACGRAADGGLVVAAGLCDELDQVTPWGVVLRALCSSEPALLEASELDSVGGLSDRRLAVVDRIRVALEAASEERPLLVALDDLQWADPPTLLALGELPLQLFSYPIGWLLARRPMPTTTMLDGVLGRLEAAGAIRLHLAPLTAADSVAVARDVVGPRPDREIADLIAGAEGNPFYIVELLRAEALKEPYRGRDPASGVPKTVRSAVGGHLRSLSAACRQLLSVASVLGREFSVAEVAAMTGEPASRLLEAVREALGAEVLIERRDRLAFRHDLLRQAVYEDLPESARAALHRDAAEALRSTGGSAVRIAGQLAIGARPGDAAAIDTLNGAVVDLTPTSPSAAADLQLRTLELISEHDDRRAGMVMAAVHSLSLAGRRGEAFALGDRYLAEHRPPPSVEAMLQLELREAWVFERVQAYPTALPQHLLSDPTVDGAIVATAIACEHANQMWDGRGEQAEGAFAEAFRIVADRDRPFELATIAYLRVVNLMLCGRTSDALAQAEAGLEAARRVERPASSGIHEMLVAAALSTNGRYRDALATLRTRWRRRRPPGAPISRFSASGCGPSTSSRRGISPTRAAKRRQRPRSPRGLVTPFTARGGWRSSPRRRSGRETATKHARLWRGLPAQPGRGSPTGRGRLRWTLTREPTRRPRRRRLSRSAPSSSAGASRSRSRNTSACRSSCRWRSAPVSARQRSRSREQPRRSPRRTRTSIRSSPRPRMRAG